MVTARSERPRFFEGQYIGAADLAATVDYAREVAREGALGGQTWGICIGLDLVEVANASGGFDYFVLPGLAFDGYGRPVVVLSPAPVPASLFADLPTGNQNVWLRYDETLNRGLRPGWESCDAGDAYARVRESFAVEVGPMSAVKDRQSGVDVAGAHVEDARLALNSVDADAPLVCDASIPHQTFPADSARWLIPLGVASWTAGAPGSLGERSADAKKVSRTLRRYVGQVAESVYAADGVLRLRDRMTDRDAGKTPDEQCSASAIKSDDLANAVDPTDSSKTLDRLIGTELVWVEGHMRVTGDARLWGTKLELRKKDGTDDGIPLHLVRGAALNADGGADLEMALGATADGKTRLVAGIAAPGNPFEPKLQLKNDGRLAVGPVIPADVKSHTILATTEGDTSSAIASAVNKVAKLQFATGATLAESAHFAFDDSTKKLRLGAGTDLAKYMHLTTGGKVGIQNEAPEQLDSDANDLVVQSLANVGITLLSDADDGGRINFADDAADPARRHAGSILYEHSPDRMEFWTNSDFRVAIDSTGNVGIGTETPAARLQIESLTDAHRLKLDATEIQAENGGVASQLSLQPDGGDTLFGASLTNQVFIGDNGRIGIGTTSPAGSIHVQSSAPNIQVDTTGGTNPRLTLAENGITRSTLEVDTISDRTLLRNGGTTSLVAEGGKVGINIGNDSPVTHLHVRGSIDGDAGLANSHIAFIENTAGGSADVLALRVGRSDPREGNNFITFFGTANIQGRIEGNAAGNGISFLTGSGDFAECLRRKADEGPIGPGRIVGVRGGTISLVTEDADNLMVTTDHAAVVGNVPAGGEAEWERIALVGQVPVMVEGAVAAGDYILPSGRNDGIGRAVPRRRLTAADAVRIVGRAWECSDDEGPKNVIVAIGIVGTGEAMADTLTQQAKRIEQLQAQIEALAARLEG